MFLVGHNIRRGILAVGLVHRQNSSAPSHKLNRNVLSYLMELLYYYNVARTEHVCNHQTSTGMDIFRKRFQCFPQPGDGMGNGGDVNFNCFACLHHCIKRHRLQKLKISPVWCFDSMFISKDFYIKTSQALLVQFM